MNPRTRIAPHASFFFGGRVLVRAGAQTPWKNQTHGQAWGEGGRERQTRHTVGEKGGVGEGGREGGRGGMHGVISFLCVLSLFFSFDFLLPVGFPLGGAKHLCLT